MNGWMKKLSTSQLLDVWQMTTNCNEPEIPLIRGWLMDEIERREPERFETWLELDEPNDNDLRAVLDAPYSCLNCERLCNGCAGLEPSYTGCAMKKAI